MGSMEIALRTGTRHAIRDTGLRGIASTCGAGKCPVCEDCISLFSLDLPRPVLANEQSTRIVRTSTLMPVVDEHLQQTEKRGYGKLRLPESQLSEPADNL